MSSSFFKCIVSVAVLALVLAALHHAQALSFKGVETFSTANSEGAYPLAVSQGMLSSYPQRSTNHTSNNNYSDIWQHYPVMALGSYEQRTNNERYHANPDEGTCIRADFCGALYKDKRVPSNEVLPLPPAEQGEGARVGYFRTQPNELFFSISNNENILY